MNISMVLQCNKINGKRASGTAYKYTAAMAIIVSATYVYYTLYMYVYSVDRQTLVSCFCIV